MADLEIRYRTPRAAYSWDRKASWRNREAAGAEGQAEPEAARRELAAKEGDQRAAALERQNLQVARVEKAQVCIGGPAPPVLRQPSLAYRQLAHVAK